MALVTLSGVISGADLENNFGDSRSAIEAVNAAGKKEWYVNADARDLTTALSVAQRVYDFTMPDDGRLVGLGLSMWNPDATSRSCSLTLTAITGAEAEISRLFPSGNPSVSVSGAAAQEFNGTRTVFTDEASTTIFLVKGVTYRLTLLRTDANGGVIDRAFGYACIRGERRYQ